jgi:hypothetical protein
LHDNRCENLLSKDFPREHANIQTSNQISSVVFVFAIAKGMAPRWQLTVVDQSSVDLYPGS